LLEQTQGLHLHAKFHLNVYVLSASDSQKQFWANFDIMGFLYRPPRTDEGQIWRAIADRRHTLTCQISSSDCFILLLSVGEKPKFLPFFELQHLVVSPIGSSLRKLNTGAQVQTFPYPTASRSFLYSNAFMAKSSAQSLTFKSVTNNQTDKKTDRQTDRQTDKRNSTFLAAPATGVI